MADLIKLLSSREGILNPFAENLKRTPPGRLVLLETSFDPEFQLPPLIGIYNGQFMGPYSHQFFGEHLGIVFDTFGFIESSPKEHDLCPSIGLRMRKIGLDKLKNKRKIKKALRPNGHVIIHRLKYNKILSSLGQLNDLLYCDVKTALVGEKAHERIPAILKDYNPTF